MNLITWLSVTCLVPVLLCWNWLRRKNKRLEQPNSSFGPPATSLSVAQRRAIVRECVVQQHRAFMLVWFAVALGVILAAIVVGFFIVSKEHTITSLTSLGGLAGDFSLATSALKLYHSSNQQLERALVNIEGGQDLPLALSANQGS